jgi:hypothetical protein
MENILYGHWPMMIQGNCKITMGESTFLYLKQMGMTTLSCMLSGKIFIQESCLKDISFKTSTDSG